MSAATLEAPAVLAAGEHLPMRKVAAVGIGNALAFYDFLTFSFFAIQIGRTFFPGGDAAHSLLYSLATFGVGFATRPIGGIVIGAYADRAGRKPAMVLSFALMGLGIVGLALTPSYAQIGIAAPVLLVAFRLIQGFALGGEVGPSTAFLIEASPPMKRGLYLALQYATQDAASLVAGIVGFSLSLAMSPAMLDDWGWRIAFLLGAAIVPFGLAMRRALPETFTAEARPAGAPRPRAPRKVLVIGLGMLGAGTVTTYVLTYMTTYAQDALHMAEAAAFGATIASGLASVVCDILCGLLTDRVGRKPVMLSAVVLLAALAVPGYELMVRLPTPWVVYGVTALFSALAAFMSGPGLISLTEALPRAVRSGALGTVYAVAIASLGGTTQFAIKSLTMATGSALAPAWYMAAALIVGAIAMAMMRETAPVRTGIVDDI